MSERLAPPTRSSGNSIQKFRIIGLLLVAIGVAGNAIIFNKILGAPSDFATLEAALGDDVVLGLLAIGATVLYSCAVPLFAFILVEGAKRTSCYWKYFLRVFGLALVSEIPYDLAMSGRVFNWGTQNPAFGLVLALALLYFFKRYNHKSAKDVLICVLVTVMAFVWANMLKIDQGLPVVLIVTALWIFRKKKGIQTLVGCIATCMCSVVDPVNYVTYIAAPMMFLLIHYYNEEPGEGNRIINYCAYPAILLAVWIVATFAF